MGIRRHVALCVAAGVAVVSLWSSGVGLAAAPTTERVSVSSAGTEGDEMSFPVAVSTGGRYVLFTSDATNLVAGDTNGKSDVFVRDTATDTTVRVSVSSAGAQANGASYGGGMSADGRFVVFESYATNLMPGANTASHSEVYVRDTVIGKTTLVSVNGAREPANADSVVQAISADGRVVAFSSMASNLVPGNPKGWEMYVRDRAKAKTGLVSVSSARVPANGGCVLAQLSADGRFVAFFTKANNLVPGDTNHRGDVFVRDRARATTRRVSVSSTGAQALGGSGRMGLAISGTGRFIAFWSDAPNLVAGDTTAGWAVFVRDRFRGTTVRISEAASDPAISSDGRYVTFASGADVFAWDRIAKTTELISVSSAGVRGNDYSFEDEISPDGHYVAFSSLASNLVPQDTNATRDVFLRGPLP